MHRLQKITALVVVAIAAAAIAENASAQQQRQSRPPPRPQGVIPDRGLFGPPPPPSSERNYYGPAPGVQQPMERVPQPAPLAQPPINR
jgi:hypothetical protein